MKRIASTFVLITALLATNIPVFSTTADAATSLIQTQTASDQLTAAIKNTKIIFATGDSSTYVTKSVMLPKTSGSVAIAWTSNNPTVISNAGVVRRAYTGDTIVTMTAKFTVGSSAQSKTYRVTVKKPTPAEKTVIDAAYNATKISFAAGDSVSSVKQNIGLPIRINSSTVTWSSSSSVITKTGTVTRPSGSDKSVKLTANIVYNNILRPKIFTVNVKAKEPTLPNATVITSDALFEKMFMQQADVLNPSFSFVIASSQLSKATDATWFNQMAKKDILDGWRYRYISNGDGTFQFDYVVTYSDHYKIIKAYKNKALESQLDSKEKQVYAKAKQIISKVVKSGMSEYEKELALHDYITTHAEYDPNKSSSGTFHPDSHDAYGVMIKGVGVCDSYSKSMSILLNLAGIEAMRVTGIAGSGTKIEPHAWNIVRIDGQYYQLDPTWNDPLTRVSGVVSELESHAYFNVTDAKMQKDHVYVKSDYPACTATSNNYYVKNNMIATNYNDFKTKINAATRAKTKVIEILIKNYSESAYPLDFIFDNNNVDRVRYAVGNGTEVTLKLLVTYYSDGRSSLAIQADQTPSDVDTDATNYQEFKTLAPAK